MSKNKSAAPTAVKQRWTSRSIGSSWQHQSFYLLIRWGGQQAAYLLLYCVVFYYTLLPSIRKKCSYYLSRRFPEAGCWQQFWNSYRMNLALGKVLVDRALVGILGADKLEVKLHGKQELMDLIDQGNGVILVNAHIGCWQVAASVLDFVETPINLLIQREEGDIDRHHFEHSGGESPYRIIDPRGYLGGVMEMLQVLKRGEVLSVMGDRMLGNDKNGVEVNFMGGTVTFPFSAYKLASATGAPIVALLSHKVGGNRYAIKISSPIEVPANLGRGKENFIPYVQEYAEILERFCEEHPFQFFNFFDMWQNDVVDD
ncbi:MAG: lysophospholipid acyltransferase family protein [Thermodesulfobacteriota bacterium]|nr:lysophospholipid acyltransferase family protein [Thermodesulfobacteriota bacterium]